MVARHNRIFLAGVGLLILALGEPAEADSRLCRQLQAKLASLPAEGGGSELYRRYDEAVGQQREEIAAARQRARGAGCGFALGLGASQCQAINLKIEQMEFNLADLQRKRQALARGGDGGREHRELLAALEDNGCGTDRRAARAAELGRDVDGNLFDRLRSGSFEDDLYADDDDDYGGAVLAVPEDAYPAYRTICVRTCDGYYFPMSPSSSRNDFARDQQNCESICPGTEMRTYYQRAEVQGVETMMSTASEEPYSELATAYLYKRNDVGPPAACGCGQMATEKNYTIIAGQGSAAEDRTERRIPRPWTRPDAGADPETLANADGGLSAGQLRELLKPKAAKRLPADERRVRVVGPAFLPDQSTAEDPPVPDRKPGP
ncbi:DUF2865 domain-containing protein [Arvimicrobium flavum]|uniref:DUF2865 domain-containing protein n=1 Tax=Arvimicrobium flavum TaxID=3393320 RepID=UPI00237ADC40|nr:DUF2865 domain-containing protein [Mesorhizobium shangrilense]